jgi:hypothetical protein
LALFRVIILRKHATKLKLSQNRHLRKVLGPERQKAKRSRRRLKMNNNLWFSTNIGRIVTSRRERDGWPYTRHGDKRLVRSVCKI